MEIFSQYDGKMLSVDEAPKLIEGMNQRRTKHLRNIGSLQAMGTSYY